MTLEALLGALTEHSPDSFLHDEVAHTGGAGISFVEQWPAVGTPLGTSPSDVWLWRVMWIPRRVRGGPHRQHTPTRVAFGVSDKGQEGALGDGRREALRLAVLRRVWAKAS
jgi:hypothetical protein